jgi:hypothetical protein
MHERIKARVDYERSDGVLNRCQESLAKVLAPPLVISRRRDHFCLGLGVEPDRYHGSLA